jgi:hypothetical protein
MCVGIAVSLAMTEKVGADAHVIRADQVLYVVELADVSLKLSRRRSNGPDAMTPLFLLITVMSLVTRDGVNWISARRRRYANRSRVLTRRKNAA